MEITLEQVKRICRQAIDPAAKDAEGSECWSSVAANVIAMARAPNVAEAAKAIASWHAPWEWHQVGDSAAASAQRIRLTARGIGIRVGKGTT